jgi:hypothetical protein
VIESAFTPVWTTPFPSAVASLVVCSWTRQIHQRQQDGLLFPFSFVGELLLYI